MLRSGLLGDDLAERAELKLPGLEPRAEESHQGTLADQHERDPQTPRHVALLRQARLLVQHGDLLLGRERLEEALRRLPTRTTPAASERRWTAALLQGLGVVGEFTSAEQLISAAHRATYECRHLAALSIGAAQGGYEVEARRYAQAAAQLAGDSHDPVLRGITAQALAHAGEVDAAEEMATRTDPADAMRAGARQAQFRQSLTAVAAGLAHRDPEAAARLIEPIAQAVELRLTHGSPLAPLPQLAGLLLASPDIRGPGPHIRELLGRASAFVSGPRQQWHPPSAVLLALLERLHCVPDTADVAEAVHGWVPTLPRDQLPYAEMALLKAVEGDLDDAMRIAEAATTSEMRSSALGAVATHLAGAEVTLSVDPASVDASIRLHLALAHAGRDRSTHDEAAARALVLKLLTTDSWASTIPLLPRVAPESLAPLAELTLELGQTEADAA